MKYLFLLWLSAMAIFMLMAVAPTDSDSQALVALVVLSGVMLLSRYRNGLFFRVLLMLASSYLTLRYFFWRTGYTIHYHDPLSLLGAVILYVAEVYGLVVFFLGLFVNVAPLTRKSLKLPENETRLPTVDIMVPSYNEPVEMLEVTLLAALLIKYPGNKLRIHLLDDGGTVQKRNDANPDKAAEALNRHNQLQTLCARLGANYITREKNEHAKAGNINSALMSTKGDLILILDADHVPSEDILQRTVGLFLQDPNLFLVQTPHFFINSDPIEKNLEVFGQMPSENEMFYSVIQRGLDFWNATFFCGSAALLKRSCLMEIGGICGTSITEDAETALTLHAKGYNSAYINHPMISGLQPESYSSFIVQRTRWAQGMVQIFLLKNPLLIKGLKPWQRICYTSSSFFWFFSFARVVFMLAPAAYLIFGLRIYDADLAQFFSYTVPHIAGTLIVSNYLFGSVRWAFISELYELMQSLFSLPAIIKVFLNPHAPSFAVTPKGEHLDEDFISQLAGPFYAIYFLICMALVAGVIRYYYFPEQRSIVAITLFWAVFNWIILNAAIGALYERRQRRGTPRMPASMPAYIFFPGYPTITCEINDLSVGGAQVILSDKQWPNLADPMPEAEFMATHPQLKQFLRVRIHIRSWRKLPNDQIAAGIQFVNLTQGEEAQVVAFAHSDSERWVQFRAKRSIPLSISSGFRVLLKLGVRYAFHHFFIISKQVWYWCKTLGRKPPISKLQ